MRARPRKYASGRNAMLLPPGASGHSATSCARRSIRKRNETPTVPPPGASARIVTCLVGVPLRDTPPEAPKMLAKKPRNYGLVVQERLRRFFSSKTLWNEGDARIKTGDHVHRFPA